MKHLTIRQTRHKRTKPILLALLWAMAMSVSAQFVTDGFYAIARSNNLPYVVIDGAVKNTGQVRNTDIASYSYYLPVPTTTSLSYDTRLISFMVKNIGSTDADMDLLKITISNLDMVALRYSGSTLIVRRYISNTSYVDYKLLDKLFDFSQKSTKPYFNICFYLSANFMWFDVTPVSQNNSLLTSTGFLHSVCFFGINYGGANYMASIISPTANNVKITFTNGHSEDLDDAANAQIYAINYSDLLPLLQNCFIGGVCSTQSNVAEYRPAITPDEEQATDAGNNSDTFLVYPNPSNGNINVMLTTATSGKVTFTVTDFSGHKAYVSEQMLEKGRQTTQLNLNMLASGLYVLTATNQSGGVIGKFKVSIK
jgi:hypothetical protein